MKTVNEDRLRIRFEYDLARKEAIKAEMDQLSKSRTAKPQRIAELEIELGHVEVDLKREGKELYKLVEYNKSKEAKELASKISGEIEATYDLIKLIDADMTCVMERCGDLLAACLRHDRDQMSLGDYKGVALATTPPFVRYISLFKLIERWTNSFF